MEDHDIHFEAIKKGASSGMESDEKKAFRKKEKKASPSSASKQLFDKEEGLTSSSPGKEECVGMIRKFEALTRKIDLIHLLRSYQSESVCLDRLYHQDFWRIRRDLKHLVSNNNHVNHEEFQHVQRRINATKQCIEKEFRDVKRNLVHEDSGIWACIPQEEDDIMSLDESLTQKSFAREGSANWTLKTEVGLTPETSGDELLEIAIDSAVRLVSNCIRDGRIRKIGISGRGGDKVASTLKDIKKVSVVLCICVSRHHSIEEVRQNIATQTGRIRSHNTDYTLKGSLDQYFPSNFLLLVDCTDGQIDLHDLKIPDCGFLVLTTQSQKVHEIMDLDLEVRMEDHLLPWKLFCWNVGPSLIHSSSVIQQMAAQLVKECDGHLHAIVFLARTLKGVTDIGVWELALNQLASRSSHQQENGMSQVIVRVLKFIWDQKDIITKRCIQNCTDGQEWSADSLVSSWIENRLIIDGEWWDVNPDGEWWDADVKVILNELSNLKSLSILELYLPSAELLQRLGRDSTEYLTCFRFTVGHHQQRIISRLPHEVEELFKKRKKGMKCLEYINGEGIPTEITKVLNHANFFFLDRHWTVKMLSDFRNENMVNLRFCLLVECNELETIIDTDYQYPLGVDKKPLFQNLKYLGIHYMRNLQSIWKGPIDEGCLSNLKVLALHTCPNLTTIFTPGLLGNLRILEELIVEDCCEIKSLVSQESSDLKSGYVLKLERISLLDLPKFVSISDVPSISPMLESLIVYNCPKLETLYANKAPSNKYLKIKGDKEWWESLKWHESESGSSIRPTYEELGRGEDLMDELARDIYSNQQDMLFL